MRKKTRLLIVGLIAIVATSSAGTLAFFTKDVTVGPNGTELPYTLNISNGQIIITAGAGDGTTTPTWSYDVAKLSTSTATYQLYPGCTDIAPIGTITSADTGYAAYELANRSKDITGIDPTGAAAGKFAVGAKVLTGTITNARPGDALVVGTAGGLEGIKVTNSLSSLTVKVKVTIKQDVTSKETIEYLNQAGWIMYINGIAVNDGVSGSTTLNLANVQTALDTLAATLAPGASLATPIGIRLELPLTTTTSLYEGKNVGTAPNVLAAFDVSTLFTITATQENNPGWSEAGN